MAHGPKTDGGYRDAFKVRHPARRTGPRIHDFPIEDVADAYTHYVLNIGIPEETFWNADVWFVKAVAADKAAYDQWYADAIRKTHGS